MHALVKILPPGKKDNSEIFKKQTFAIYVTSKSPVYVIFSTFMMNDRPTDRQNSLLNPLHTCEVTMSYQYACTQVHM